jgi:hypothetical protein
VRRLSIRGVVAGGVCFLALLIALLFRFVVVSEERKIEMTLKHAVKAVRDEDLGGCMKHIALAEWDTTQVKGDQLEAVIQEGFDTFDNIRVLYEEVRTEVEGKRGVVRMKVKVIASYDDQLMLLLGTLTEGKEIELGMVKEGRRWLISSLSGVDIPVDVLEEF